MGALFGVSDLKIAFFGRAVILLNLAGQTVCHAQWIAPPGSMEGQGFWMSEDFDDPLDELFDVLKEDEEAER